MYSSDNSKIIKNNMSLLLVFLLLLEESIVYLKEIKNATREIIEKETILLLLEYLIQLLMYSYLLKINFDKIGSLIINMIIFIASIEGLIIVGEKGKEV